MRKRPVYSSTDAGHRPKGAYGFTDGSYYKVCLQGKLWYWHNGEWRLSGKCKEEVVSELLKKEDPFSYEVN